MKHAILSVLLAAVLLLTAGCYGKDTPNGDSEGPDADHIPPYKNGPPVSGDFDTIDPLEQAMQVAFWNKPAEDDVSQPESPEEPVTLSDTFLHMLVRQQELDGEEIGAELIRLVNKERKNAGLSQLKERSKLAEAAEIRAGEIPESISHNRPGGDPYYTVFDEVGFSYTGKWHGQNICTVHFTGAEADGGETEIAEGILAAFLESEGHKSNLLREKFVETGVGVHIEYGEDTVQIYAVQLFAGL